MCDDPNIRTQAASEQFLDWLQNVNIRPSQHEIKQKLTTLCQRLNIPPIPLQTALVMARRKGATRAAERLEELDDE
jgi:hypothetical protein